MKIEVFFEGKKGVNANVNGHIVKTDQPVEFGGDGSAPAPFDLFLASIATCSGIYIKSFCDNRNLPTDNIKIFMQDEYDEATKMITKINIEIQVPADFPENYIDVLAQVAGKCKVKKHLEHAPEITAFTTVVQ
jgi:putative redox protein